MRKEEKTPEKKSPRTGGPIFISFILQFRETSSSLLSLLFDLKNLDECFNIFLYLEPHFSAKHVRVILVLQVFSIKFNKNQRLTDPWSTNQENYKISSVLKQRNITYDRWLESA